MHGIKYLEDGSEAEYVDVDESQQFALFSLGWRMVEDNDLFDDNLDM